MSANRVCLASTILGLLCCACDKDIQDTQWPETGDSPVDTDTTEPDEGPCSGGGWGAIQDPDNAIHVRTDGSDVGDGNVGDPVATLEQAVELARARSTDKLIALGQGTFTGGADLEGATDLGETDNGTVIQGCGVGETIIETSDGSATVFHLDGASGVVIQGLTSRGGTRNVQALNGANATLEDLIIEDATEVGVFAHGTNVELVLSDVEVHDTQAGRAGVGYGFAFQHGATVTMSGGGAWSNVAAGVLLDGVTEVCLDGVTIEGTQPTSAGWFGRGISVQNASAQVSILDSTVTRNADAGLFAVEPLSVTVTGSTFHETGEGAIPDGTEATGDGMVFVRPTDDANPSLFNVTLQDNIVSSSARAGIVLDGVTASVSGTIQKDNDFSEGGTSLVSQGSADLSSSTDDIATMSDTEALGLNVTDIDVLSDEP